MTLFTLDFGKIRALAKGTKKITSRRSPHLQTANLIMVQMTQKESYFYLDSTDLVSGFTTLKNNSKKMSYVYIYFFILDRVLPEGQKEESIYYLTKKFLVENAKKTSFAIPDLTLHLNLLLKALGYLKEDKLFTELIQFTESIINEKIPLHII